MSRTSSCWIAAATKSPIAPNMGVSTMERSAEPGVNTEGKAFCGLGLKPGFSCTPISTISALKIADISRQMTAKTRGLSNGPILGIPAKNRTGCNTTPRTTSPKLPTGLERSYSPPDAERPTPILDPLAPPNLFPNGIGLGAAATLARSYPSPERRDPAGRPGRYDVRFGQAHRDQRSPLRRAEEGAVGPPVPGHARLCPVTPAALRLGRGRDAVGYAGEDGPALAHYQGAQREGGDRTQERTRLLLGDSCGLEVARRQREGVTPEQARRVHGRVADEDAVDPPFQARQERRHVPAQGVAHQPDGRSALLAAEPADQTPYVPHGLGGGVQRVHHVAREYAVAAHRSDAARAVDRQHWEEEVEPELAVQVIRAEEPDVRARGAHPDAVQANEPRARTAGVLERPGVRRAVPLVREPALPARFPGPRLV